MQRANEGLELKRTMEGLGFIMQSAQVIPQTPYINWKGLFNKMGDALNMPDLGDMLDVDLAMQIAGQMSQEPDPRANQPRLSKDAGASGQAIPYQKPAQARELMGGVRGQSMSGNARSA